MIWVMFALEPCISQKLLTRKKLAQAPHLDEHNVFRWDLPENRVALINPLVEHHLHNFNSHNLGHIHIPHFQTHPDGNKTRDSHHLLARHSGSGQ